MDTSLMQRRIGHVRWGIAGLLGTGIVINYLDRINISVATKPFEQEFHLSAGEMGIINSSYLWSYVLLQLPVGALLDRFGVKWLVRIGTFVWAVASYMTAIVSGLGLVLLSRILLGAAEAPNFPGAAKATGYWFPTRERGLATSAFDAAAKFSNVIGIPLVALAVTLWGWRAGFYMTGTLSLLYCAFFWIAYHDPSKSKRLTSEERTYIVEGGAQREGENTGNPLANLGFLLRQRKVWALTLGFMAYGYVFYLFLSWIPGYLQTGLHMTVLSSGFYTIIPWVVATISIEMLLS
jgi:MFS transporter, ACS family, D-galactonate transporter